MGFRRVEGGRGGEGVLEAGGRVGRKGEVKKGSADFTWRILSYCFITCILDIREMIMSNKWQMVILATLAVLLTAQTCPAGQYRDANRLCQACPASCTTCENPTACTSCAGNFFLVSAGG